MTELTFNLTPAELTAYQFAVRDRLLKDMPKAWWEREGVRAVALVVLTALSLVLADALIGRSLDREAEPIELAVGMVIGSELVIAAVWITYYDQRRRLVRPDGPTLGEQTLKVSGDGLDLALSNISVRYRWPAFQHVSRARGLLLMWIEPGSAIGLPERAFESVAALEAFEAEVRAHLVEAKLPKAGAFG